jgi:tetratricopeptide (TPR) repeat protein
MLRIQERKWAAFFIALMFGVHPIMAEPVSWVSGLSTPIFSAFYLLALHLFWSHLEGKGQKYFWLSLLAFVFAGFSKSAAATLPFVLVALEWWRNGTFSVTSILRKWPFWLFSAALVGYTFITRSAEGHNFDVTKAYSLVDRVFMVSQTLFFYPVKLLFPFGFSISYPFPKVDGTWRADYYLALPALLLVIWWIKKNWQQHRETILALALYFFPLILMLPLITVGSFEMRSDRYVYLPSIGIFLLLMLAAEKIKMEPLRFVFLGLLSLFFAFQGMQQTKVWKDGTALFKNCVEKTPDVALCQCNLGYSELLAKRFETSVEHYSKSLQLDPSYVESYNGRGQAYLNLNPPKVSEALSDFTKAIEAGIVTPKLFFNRGKCLAMSSKFSEAIPDLTKSIELEPKSPETWYFRAFSHEKTAAIDKAFQDYSKAIELNPNYVEALVNRALIFYNQQKYPESIDDNSKAIKVASGNVLPMILVNRANAYLKSGNLDKALEDVNQALAYNNNYPRAYQTRAAIYTQMGQVDKAQADLKRINNG